MVMIAKNTKEYNGPPLVNKPEADLETVSDIVSNASSSENNNPLDDYRYIPPSLYGFKHAKFIEILKHFSKTVKLGYTTRAVLKRIKEWSNKKGYGEWTTYLFDVEASFVSSTGETVYFTDLAIHKELIKMGYLRTVDRVTEDETFLVKDALDPGFVVSQEFFTALDNSDLPEINRDLISRIIEEKIKPAYENNTGEHSFFHEVKGEKLEREWKPTKEFEPREYQKRAVTEVLSYIRNIKNSNMANKDAMLWAPTRSGKTLIAGWLLEKYAYDYENFPKEQKVIVLASAMADVYWEWKETFESQISLGGINPDTGKQKFAFVGKQRMQKPGAITEALKKADHAVVFLTLQDLSGSARDGLKASHENLFDNEGSSIVDYLVADECHYAVMSDVYGATIAFKESISELNENTNTEKAITDSHNNTDYLHDFDTNTEEGLSKLKEKSKALAKNFSSLSPTDGRLLVSATPLEILFKKNSGFQIGKNVSVVSTEDIEADKELWYQENVINGNLEEHLSPYFGIIENALSFAVNIGDPSKIFAPDETGEKFLHHDLAVSIIKGLFSEFSSEVKGVPNFFADPSFKATGCGKNILFVLPRRLSCDIFERVLREEGLDQKNAIFNISSFDSEYDNFDAQQIKSAIDTSGKNTITLTVNKMTTGVSVKKWDTVVVMTSGESIQHQIQIMGRVNTPWVQELEEKDGFGITHKRKIIKKQTTAVIHFSADTLYTVRESMDSFYKRADKKSTTSDGSRDLVGGKIFAVSDNGYLKPMTAIDIRKVLNEKLFKKGISRMVDGLQWDFELVPDVDMSGIDRRHFFNSSSSENGIRSSLFELPEGAVRCEKCMVNELTKDEEMCKVCSLKEQDRKNKGRNSSDKGNKGIPLFIDPETGAAMMAEEDANKEKTIITQNLAKAILIYSVVSYCEEHSLDEIRETINASGIIDNKIPQSKLYLGLLGINSNAIDLVKNSVVNNDLDYYISNIRSMMTENTTDKEENRSTTIDSYYSNFNKLSIAMNGLSSLSSNEIFTPKNVASIVVDMLNFSDNDWLKALVSEKNGFIDNGAKSGVFIVELFSRIMKAIESKFENTEDETIIISGKKYKKNSLIKILKDSLYAVPTSASAFVIIDRVYHDYGLNLENIIGREVFTASNGLNLDNFAYNLTKLVDININGKFKKHTCIETIFGNFDAYVSALSTKKDKELFSKYFISIANIVNNDTVWRLVKKLTDKKFDAAVGNPPYQDEGNFSTYQNFALSAIEIGENVSMVHKAGFAIGSSKGDTKPLLEKIVEMNCTKEIHYYPNAGDLFSNVESMPGGVVVYNVLKENKQENVNFFVHKKGLIEKSSRFLVNSEGGITLEQDKLSESKLRKIKGKYGSFFNLSISTQKPYGFSTLTGEELSAKNGDYCAYSNAGKGFISKSRISKNIPSADNYKVAFSKADGASIKRQEYMGEPYLANPGDVLSETYHISSAFTENNNDRIITGETLKEAVARAKFMKTRVFRDLVRMTNPTHNLSHNNYRYVPIMDFTTTTFDLNAGTVNWMKSIEDIERQLVEIWGWSKEEWNHTKENVKKMKTSGVNHIKEKPSRNQEITQETYRRWDVIRKQISDAKHRAEKKHGQGSADGIIASSIGGPAMLVGEPGATNDYLYTMVSCYVLDESTENLDPEDDDFEQQLDYVFDKVITKRKYIL